MRITSRLSRLFRRGGNATPQTKEESLVDHFKNLGKIKASLREPVDRGRLAKRVFQRTIADMKVTRCDVANGKATFSTGGSVWTFDAKTQTPILRQQSPSEAKLVGGDEDISSIEQYKAFSNTSEDIPDEIYSFYSRGFITWTTCAQFATHEIINRACAVRGEDAVAVGYKLSYADEDESGKIADENKDGKTDAKEAATKDDFLTALEKQTKRMGIDEVLRKLDYNKCVYGIAVAVPTFDGDVDMSLPFNIDAEGLDRYTGFTVIEPYWLCPMFDHADSSDPSSKHFFEPTWWRLPNGKMIHRSWCIKAVNSHVADILKPTYIYGGIPLTQMIYERVFAADKCANEAPMLALTKRLLVVDANIQQVISDPKHVKDLMDVVTYCRTNWGVMFKQPTANINQIDTSLGEYDQLIMTQYQLVASIAQMPATKLLKVTPTGFQSTGEYEWKDWAQSLIDIQEMEFTPLLERHLQLLTRKRGKSVAVTVTWNAVDAPTAKEKAEVQSVKVGSLAELLTSGALSVEEVRNILRNDKDGDFTGLSSEPPQKDAGMMEQLAKEMGGDENPNEAGDAGAPSADEVETGDDAEFESKHKRDKDGKFVRGAGVGLRQTLLEYKKERGTPRFDKRGNHIYMTRSEMAEAAKRAPDWTFPKKSQSAIAKDRSVSQFMADHFNDGDRKPDMRYFNKNKREVKFCGKTSVAALRPGERYERSAKPKYGFNVEKKRKRNPSTGRMVTVEVRTPIVKKGKPIYDWRGANDKEAYELEHALVNAGYGILLSHTSSNCVVRRDFANARGQVATYFPKGSDNRQYVQEQKSARVTKDMRIAQVNSVFDNADGIFNAITRDFTKRDDDFAKLAYFQYRTTMRVGSSKDNENLGAMDLTKSNVTVAGNTIIIDADMKNGRWHTELDDEVLAKWFKQRVKQMKSGEPFFSSVNYGKYNEYLTELGKRLGIKPVVKTRDGKRVEEGLTSHDMRRLSASLLAASLVDKIKINPKKDRDGYIEEIEGVIRAVAKHINDKDAGVPWKSYICPKALWHNAMHIYESDDRFVPPTGR